VEVNKRRWWLKGSDGGKRKGKWVVVVELNE
jgi:hypothetical protein